VLNAGVRPAKQEEQDEGAPAWMVTFGDMMTLLLTFFILLVSMSVIRDDRFEAAKKSLREIFLRGTWKPIESPIRSDTQRANPRSSEPLDAHLGPDAPYEEAVIAIKQQIDAGLKDIGLGGLVATYMQKREVRIRIESGILFGVDSAEIEDLQAFEVLHGLAHVLSQMDYCIDIEGHTADRDLVGDAFEDLWELSSERSLTVLRYFKNNGIDPRRLSAIGFGPTRPVAENDTFQGRAMNRRVEIVVRDVTPKDIGKRSTADRGR
jgi:chemotaxis protein MotB